MRSSPRPVIALALSDRGFLATSSEDRAVRTYKLPNDTVFKAIRIESVKRVPSALAWAAAKDNLILPHLWLACGDKLYRFHLDSPKLVLDAGDVSETISPLRNDGDSINKIAVNMKCTYLAYATEMGEVGVISLADNRRFVMRTSHTTVCDCLNFIPIRPWDLVSGGYDYALLHHDFSRGTLLSHLVLGAESDEPTSLSLSPPFILSMSISENGNIACGLGSGEIYIGFGISQPKKKGEKSKWAGLDERGVRHRVADGPIVAITYLDNDHLLACTLLGNMMVFQVSPEWKLLRSNKVKGLVKINAAVCSGLEAFIGGIASKNKGGVVAAPVMELLS